MPSSRARAMSGSSERKSPRTTLSRAEALGTGTWSERRTQGRLPLATLLWSVTAQDSIIARRWPPTLTRLFYSSDGRTELSSSRLPATQQHIGVAAIRMDAFNESDRRA